MLKDFKKILFFIIWPLTITSNLKADTSDIKEILEIIQKDLRTLERAVYSESFTKSSKGSSTQDTTIQNAEDVLTKHLLKLSEIEKQFQDLTNKYEEINFKLDKLSSRLSKVQADNQLRFQNLETKTTLSSTENNSLTSKDSAFKFEIITNGQKIKNKIFFKSKIIKLFLFIIMAK